MRAAGASALVGSWLALVASSGVANWIEGVQLLAVCAVAALVFWYLWRPASMVA